MRLFGVVGVAVGGLTAGLMKRRKPLKGNAFFEGLIVALAHVWFSLLVSKAYFTMGCVDWATYAVTGILFAAIASLQVKKSSE
jgi:hypothetical protein